MKWLRVRNWHQFQHYADRSPPWIKVYVELLTNYEFTRLPEVTRAHLIGIWLLASRMDGRIPCDPEWLGSRISAVSPVDLDSLVDAGFLEHETALAGDASISREEKSREDSRQQRVRAGVELISLRFPDEYREDFHQTIRGSHRPEALIAEIRRILDGDDPSTKGATGDDVGLAIRDVALAGKILTGSLLRGFVRGAMQRRETPPVTTIRLPKAPHDEFAAARQAMKAPHAG